MNGPGIVSGKICGSVRKDDMNVKPTGLVGPRTFMSSGGKLKMVFNHAYVSELVDALLQGGNPRKKATLRVEVAFTAYKSKGHKIEVIILIMIKILFAIF